MKHMTDYLPNGLMVITNDTYVNVYYNNAWASSSYKHLISADYKELLSGLSILQLELDSDSGQLRVTLNELLENKLDIVKPLKLS